MTKVALVDSASDIVERVDLKDIFFIELRAARLEGLLLPHSEADIPAENAVFHRMDGDTIEVRLVTTVVSDNARVSVDLMVQYSKLSPFEATPDAMTDFVQKVALMAGYPYLREAVSSLTSRLRVDTINMGILRASDVAFARLDDEIDRDVAQ